MIHGFLGKLVGLPGAVPERPLGQADHGAPVLCLRSDGAGWETKPLQLFSAGKHR